MTGYWCLLSLSFTSVSVSNFVPTESCFSNAWMKTDGNVFSCHHHLKGNCCIFKPGPYICMFQVFKWFLLSKSFWGSCKCKILLYHKSLWTLALVSCCRKMTVESWVRVGKRSWELTQRNCQQEFISEVLADYLTDILDKTTAVTAPHVIFQIETSPWVRLVFLIRKSYIIYHHIYISYFLIKRSVFRKCCQTE